MVVVMVVTNLTILWTRRASWVKGGAEGLGAGSALGRVLEGLDHLDQLLTGEGFGKLASGGRDVGL